MIRLENPVLEKRGGNGNLMAVKKVKGMIQRRALVEQKGWGMYLRIGFLVFGLLLVAALMADISGFKHKKVFQPPDVSTELQNIVLNLDGPRFADPGGLFSVVIPAGWKVSKPPECDPYNVVLMGSHSADISIMARRVPYNTLPELFSEIEKREKQFGLATKVDTIRFLGRPAVKRSGRLNRVRIFAVDFVENYVAHHIMCAVSPEYYDRYEPVLMEILGTYEPGKKE